MARLIVKSNGTRLRKEPSTSAPILATIGVGASYEIITKLPADANGFEWYQIPGYLREDVVTPILEPDPLPDGEIPYISQWDDEANSRGADCGQTCVAMVARKYGINVKVNDLRFQSTSSGLTTGQNLVDNFGSVGIKARWKYSHVTDDLKHGDICLVKYSGFDRASVQDDGYKGWHWVVFLEWATATIVVHDPDFWGSRRGEGNRKHYSVREWENAFISANSLGRIIVEVVEDATNA